MFLGGDLRRCQFGWQLTSCLELLVRVMTDITQRPQPFLSVESEVNAAFEMNPG